MSDASTDPTEAEVLAAAAAEANGEVTPPAESKPRKPKKDLSEIEYIGTADVKSLTVVDLENVGVEEPRSDLTWDVSNNFIVDVKDVDASTLEYLRSQPDFTIR